MASETPADDAYESVATTADVPAGTIKRVAYRGEAVALVCLNDRYYALANTCAHQNISLSIGRLRGGHLVCLGHGWIYELESGRVLLPRGTGAGVACYDVRLEGDQILIAPRAPEGEPPARPEQGASD
jgi:nitrite reductase/ring-hydroxylating ferredoxin subunit